jgi:hypothetical protein
LGVDQKHWLPHKEALGIGTTEKWSQARSAGIEIADASGRDSKLACIYNAPLAAHAERQVCPAFVHLFFGFQRAESGGPSIPNNSAGIWRCAESSTRAMRNSKHDCENWGSANGLCAYVSRGTLTAAAIALGYPVTAYRSGPHVQIGVSITDLR